MKDESKLFKYKVETAILDGVGTTNYIEDNISQYLVLVKLLPRNFYERNYTPTDPDNLQDKNGQWYQAGIDNFR